MASNHDEPEEDHRSEEQIKADNPDLKAFETYDELLAAIKEVLN